jgi:glutamyl-tRNA synthetase
VGIENTNFSPTYVEGVCKLVKEKSHFVTEFWESGKYFFIAPENFDTDVVKKRWNEQSKNFIETLIATYKNLANFNVQETETAFKLTADKLGIGSGTVMQLFRVCLSGVGGGPVLFEMVELLGKEEVLIRLETALNKLSK